MFICAFQSNRPARARFLSGVALWVTLLAATSLAQSGSEITPPPPGSGNAMIQGYVYNPSGRRVDQPFMLRLHSTRGGEQITTTNSNGEFFFRGLRGGRYNITIDAGEAYQTVNETVDILEPPGSGQGRRPTQIYTVQIRLQLKPSELGKPGVVNAALREVPKEALKLYAEALKSAQEGDRKKAIEQLKNALAIDPSFVQALNGLGVQYLKLNQMVKAAEAFRAAIKLTPDMFILHLNYGIVLVEQKNFTEAEAELRQALEKNEASATAHLYRGRALASLNRYQEAQEALQRAISLGGEEVSLAHRYLGAVFMALGDNPRAIESLEKYLTLVPQAKDAEQIRGVIKQLREKN